MNAILYLSTICVWGSTWLAIKYQLGVVPSEVSIFYRFAIASGILLLWCFTARKTLRFPLKIHGWFLIQGFFLFSFNYVLAYAAGYYIPSGINAIGFSMVLVFNIINSYLFYKQPITLQTTIGALSGIAGILAIFWPALSSLDLSSTSLWGMFLSLSAGVFASFGNMISAQIQRMKVGVTESNAMAMSYGALWMLGIIAFTDVDFAFDPSPKYVFSLLHLAITGSVIAFGCYLTLLGRIGASKASYTLVLVPVVALVVSTIFEDFVWEPHIFAGVGMILLGNVIILSKKLPKPLALFKGRSS